MSAGLLSLATGKTTAQAVSMADQRANPVPIFVRLAVLTELELFLEIDEESGIQEHNSTTAKSPAASGA